MTVRSSMLSAVLLVAAALPLRAQDRGAAQLHSLVAGLTVTARVLIIGAGPVDADADLTAWLAKGRLVQTAYLSLTRGESSPNFTGMETGIGVSAIRTQEVLAARKLDGAEQYFTRAYDFGHARSADDAFRHWEHEKLLAQVVTVVRAFRPHVIVSSFTTDTLDRDGQHQASAIIAREVFDAAQDTVRFSSKSYGLPWSPLSLYEPGAGVTIDSREYDPVRGVTYADIAVESRSQLRSFGFEVGPWQQTRLVHLRRVASRTRDSTQASHPPSLFDGIDTSFARFQAGMPPANYAWSKRDSADLVRQIPGIIATADSARRALDLDNPERALPWLRRTAELASIARGAVHGCHHPSRDAALTVSNTPCRAAWLDFDASIDLVQRRANEALLAAAGVTFEAVADREFLASGDTALVTVTVVNHGDSDVSVNDVRLTGDVPVRMLAAADVPAHGSVRLYRSVANLAIAQPWWVSKPDENFYAPTITSLDGIPATCASAAACGRSGMVLREFGINDVALPETMRRLSDVTATVTVAHTTITSSVGSIVFRSADPVLGVRDNVVSGVPAVTLGFERALDWAQAGKPLNKELRVTLRSFSDKPRKIDLELALLPLPEGLHVDSLPRNVPLALRDVLEVPIHLRGSVARGRYEFGIKAAAQRDTFSAGFRTVQYSYLPAIHFFRSSAVYLQAVDVVIPARLSVAYVQGVADDGAAALRSLGVPAYVFNDEGLLRFDLDGMSTVLIGPNAYQTNRDLTGQTARLMAFARKGGTIVIMNNPQAVAQSGVLPFPVSFARPFAERVSMPDAPVVTSDSRARLLTWPNAIRPDDWAGWVGERANFVPTTADPRYATVVEMHDPGERENRNAILVATVGKGRVIYTTLTITQQLANGVPGAMRLLVNLLCAGLPVDRRIAASGP